MLKRLWNFIRQPSARWSVGGLVGAGFLIAVVLLVSNNVAMQATSTESFCADACHEMTDNVAKEFIGTGHDTNHSGSRATCVDCHLPKPLGPKLLTKIIATKEIYHHILGTLDTPEKFEEHRLRLANSVIKKLIATDSRECRDCHTTTKMAFDKQHEKAAEYHQNAFKEGKTCIDCHKGLAHKLPRELQEKVDAPGQPPE